MKIKLSKYLNESKLIRIIMYFVIITIITLSISAFITYNMFSASFENEITTYNNNVLNQLRIFSDDFILKNVCELVINFEMSDSFNSDIYNIINNSSENSSTVEFNIHRTLHFLAYQNRDYIDSIYFHLKNEKLLISSNFIMHIDENAITQSNEYNWINEFYKSDDGMLWLKPREVSTYSNPSEDMGNICPVVFSYPLSATGSEKKGCITLYVKEDSLSKYLLKFNAMKHGQLMIIDDTGSIISTSNNSDLYMDISKEPFIENILKGDNQKYFITNFNNIKQVVCYTRSKYYNWYYVSIVTAESFYRKDLIVKRNIFSISIIVLVIILIFSNVFAFLIYVPFKKIIHKYIPSISNHFSENINEYDLLDNIFEYMSSKIYNLQYKLDKHSLIIKYTFLNELLHNRISTRYKLEYLLKASKLSFPKRYYCVVVFSIDKAILNSYNQGKIHFINYSLINFFSRSNRSNYSCTPVDTNTTDIFVIINSDFSKTENLTHFITQVQTFCFNNFKFKLIIGTGIFVDELLYIHKSYKYAKMSIKNKFIYPDQNEFYYEEILMRNASSINLTDDLCNKMDKALKTLNYNEVKGVIDTFINTCHQNNLSYTHIRQQISKFVYLYKQYLTNMNIHLDDLVDESTQNKLFFPDNINMFIDTFLCVIYNSFNYISNKKTNKNAELVEMIQKYVMNNVNLELSLNSTAEAMAISQYYLSRIFKEETGIKYIDFVINCKIQKAKELISTTHLNVEDISNLIGYSNSTYFVRKFKEIVGKTPNEYRKEIYRLMQNNTNITYG